MSEHKSISCHRIESSIFSPKDEVFRTSSISWETPPSSLKYAIQVSSASLVSTVRTVPVHRIYGKPHSIPSVLPIRPPLAGLAVCPMFHTCEVKTRRTNHRLTRWTHWLARVYVSDNRIHLLRTQRRILVNTSSIKTQSRRRYRSHRRCVCVLSWTTATILAKQLSWYKISNLLFDPINNNDLCVQAFHNPSSIVGMCRLLGNCLCSYYEQGQHPIDGGDTNTGCSKSIHHCTLGAKMEL